MTPTLNSGWNLDGSGRVPFGRRQTPIHSFAIKTFIRLCRLLVLRQPTSFDINF
jgi:hypothetical protein